MAVNKNAANTNNVRLAPGVPFLAFLAWLNATAAIGAETLTLAPQEAWSNVFGDRPIEFRYQVESKAAFQGRLGWALSADQRTLQRGETAVTVNAGGKSVVMVKPQVPPVREGVVLSAVLTVEVYGPQGGSLARQQRPLWVFAENPFAGRTEWLKQRKLILFDPSGETARCLESVGVQFRHEKRLAAIEGLKEGILLVGEGLSLGKHRGLDRVMIATARRGVPVVCLALAEGKLHFPGSPEDDPLPAEIHLQHEEAITHLDKRLDARHWPPDGQSVASSLVIQAEKGQVVAAVESGPKGWEWIEGGYPAPGARLVVCGFGIVPHWDATPAPRYFLARLLEYVGEDTPHPSRESDRRQ